jgi:protein TonB
MRETRLGLATSVVVHLTVLILSYSLFAGEYSRPQVIAVDFALVGDESQPIAAVPKNEKREKTPPGKPEKLSREKPDEPDKPVPFTPPIMEKVAPESAQAGIVSELQSDTAAQDVAALADSSTEGKEGRNEGAGQIPGGETLLSGGKDYNYIRDEVLKNIRYPIQARRMGFEGKAVISFIVLENGLTSEITVVKSSGHWILDESAREGIAKTVISKKVPYRIVVRLPVVYALRSSGEG